MQFLQNILPDPKYHNTKLLPLVSIKIHIMQVTHDFISRLSSYWNQILNKIEGLLAQENPDNFITSILTIKYKNDTSSEIKFENFSDIESGIKEFKIALDNMVNDLKKSIDFGRLYKIGLESKLDHHHKADTGTGVESKLDHQHKVDMGDKNTYIKQKSFENILDGPDKSFDNECEEEKVSDNDLKYSSCSNELNDSVSIEELQDSNPFSKILKSAHSEDHVYNRCIKPLELFISKDDEKLNLDIDKLKNIIEDFSEKEPTYDKKYGVGLLIDELLCNGHSIKFIWPESISLYNFKRSCSVEVSGPEFLDDLAQELFNINRFTYRFIESLFSIQKDAIYLLGNHDDSTEL